MNEQRGVALVEPEALMPDPREAEHGAEGRQRDHGRGLRGAERADQSGIGADDGAARVAG